MVTDIQDLLNAYRNDGKLKVLDWSYRLSYSRACTEYVYSGDVIQICNPNPDKDFSTIRATDKASARKEIIKLMQDDDFRVAFAILTDMDADSYEVGIESVEIKNNKKKE